MEEKNENVVEETTQETADQVEEVKQETTDQVEETNKPNINEDGDYVVDLSKPIENETKEDNADNSGVVAELENAESTQEQKEIQPEAEAQEETAVLEEITEDSTEEQIEEVEEKVEEAIAEAEATGKPLPENIQKLVDFMEETGGDINDYVKLNQDYTKLNDNDVVFEYYKQTKPHLTNEEINFLMEDTFNIDEDEDTDREIRRKKLAFKEQLPVLEATWTGKSPNTMKKLKLEVNLQKNNRKL